MQRATAVDMQDPASKCGGDGWEESRKILERMGKTIG